MTSHTENASTEIRPFRIAVSDADLIDLRERLTKARWPQHPSGEDWSRGVPTTYLRGLAEYWATGFDWRAQEAAINEIPQFITTIDGQDIHFLHVRSANPDAVPLILTHGWPSSFVEFLDVIEPLSADFHLVVPTLPGYGFSAPVADEGWGNLFRVAMAWAELMNRLGYEQYAVHGTDAGSGVSQILPMVAPGKVLGVHVTGTAPSLPFGPAIDTTGLDETDRHRAERFNQYQQDGIGYLHIQSTRPQTLGYGLNDSPIAQLAWIAEKFREWTDPAAKLPEDAVGRDRLLTAVSVYWFTGAGASSAHALYEGMQVYRQMAASSQDQAAAPPAARTAYAVFAGDDTIRSLVDPAGHAERWTEHDRGGHFPAMEVPDLLSADIKAFFLPDHG
ncbi:epoxide hydrolase family protein [Allokutzneria sp. NRRL B-24872]|uniref:epoxide hydrolase family protein n=1 Tax=Allokutzneria sp. NRRL B-24872 TaxID=1137961 RepID=UPI000A3B325E|nr:epoxide hydrolase [Allokutzneria sp. NRRL B-24872]